MGERGRPAGHLGVMEMTGAKVTGADPGRSSGRAKDRFPALRNGGSDGT